LILVRIRPETMLTLGLHCLAYLIVTSRRHRDRRRQSSSVSRLFRSGWNSEHEQKTHVRSAYACILCKLQSISANNNIANRFKCSFRNN